MPTTHCEHILAMNGTEEGLFHVYKLIAMEYVLPSLPEQLRRGRFSHLRGVKRNLQRLYYTYYTLRIVLVLLPTI
jgi:hypothetical protein